MFNYLMAGFWLLLACGLFLYPIFSQGQGVMVNLGTTQFNGGWLALLLGLWNGVRIWARLSQKKMWQQEQEAFALREKQHRHEPPVTDPRFQFDKPEDPHQKQ